MNAHPGLPECFVFGCVGPVEGFLRADGGPAGPLHPPSDRAANAYPSLLPFAAIFQIPKLSQFHAGPMSNLSPRKFWCEAIP